MLKRSIELNKQAISISDIAFMALGRNAGDGRELNFEVSLPLLVYARLRPVE